LCDCLPLGCLADNLCVIRMAISAYQEIKNSLRDLYLDDPRPWIVGFSSGKDPWGDYNRILWN
jgi:hypothetical protein